MEAYLDNSATTRCSESATQLMMKLLTQDFGNPSSMHRKGMEAENYIRGARKKIAGTLKALEKEICFTSGGTEANNLAIIGAAAANRRAGKHIITSQIEHPSVLEAMKYLQGQGYEITYLPVDGNGIVSLEDLERQIRQDTIMVSLMHVNNEIGAVEPIEEAGAIIKAAGSRIIFHVDAIQSYGKMRINPKKAGIDLLSASGHKIHGPKGIGFLYIRDKTKICPVMFGGGQQKGMRSGTENVPAIAGLGAAVEELYEDFEEHIGHMYRLKEHFVREAAQLPGVLVNAVFGGEEEGIRRSAPHIVSISIEGVRAEVMLHAMEEKGIYISAGSACSSNKPSVSSTLKSIGLKESLLDSTVRFSFSVHTTIEETDYALDAMRQLVPQLQKYTRR